MNILYLDHFNRHGGAQEYIIDLAHAMRRDSHSVAISKADIQSLQTQIGDLPSLNFRILTDNFYSLHALRKFLSDILSLKVFLSTHPIDIIHANSIPALLLGFLSHSEQKIVFTCHDYSLHWIKKLIVKIAADSVISVSQAIYKMLRSNRISQPNVIVYNGFPDITGIAKPRNCISNHVRFGFIGRFDRWKGCDLFIDAAKIVQSQVSNSKFLMIGYCENKQYENHLIDRAESAHVEVIPFIGDKHLLYSTIDVVVNTSISPEPFGRTLVEAGIFSLPAIGPNQAGPAEIIVHEKTGLLFFPGNIESLCGAMLHLASEKDSRIRMGANARKRFLECFHIDNIARQVMTLSYNF